VGQDKNRKPTNKKDNKEAKRIARLRILIGIDLCACGPHLSMKCIGQCRDNHFDSKTGQVRCTECYRLDPREVKPAKSNKPRRYGQQKSSSERSRRSDFNSRDRKHDNEEWD